MKFLQKLFSSKEEIQKAEILLEERSPICPITAIVEQDTNVVYFYLWGSESSNFGVKSCWVRNLKEAPETIDESELKKGNPPMQTKQFCRFSKGQEKLKKEDLEIIWFEEGDGAALLLNQKIIAVIPAWSGFGGFKGYARDCIGEGEFSWELKPNNEIYKRVELANKSWQVWEFEPNPFTAEQPRILDVYTEQFGKSEKYFSIDGIDWPPRGLYLRIGDLKSVFATVGLSLFPMPTIEMQVANRFDHHRIELGMILNKKIDEQETKDLANWISGQAAIPWQNVTFLGEGHTINFEVFSAEKFNSVLLTNSLDCLPTPDLGEYRESTINFLWMIPITQKERAHIRENGSEILIKRLNKLGDEVFSLNRKEVVD